MTEETLKSVRKKEVQAYKRQKILDAASGLFREKGLDGTTMRAIATAAGYSTGAPYAYFQSKEEIYADLLDSSLSTLFKTIEAAANAQATPIEQITGAFASYFRYYFSNPEELQLGLYLFSSGEIKKRGFSSQTNDQLNGKLRDIRELMSAYLEQNSSVDAQRATIETLDAMTYFTGCLMLGMTGRLGTIGAEPQEMIDRYINQMLKRSGF